MQKEASQFLETNKTEVQKDFKLEALSFEIMQRAVKNYYRLVDLDWETDNPASHRDFIMAENLFWLADTIYPDKKFIIWGTQCTY